MDFYIFKKKCCLICYSFKFLLFINFYVDFYCNISNFVNYLDIIIFVENDDKCIFK